jgi:large conductance mechanosensitive channel
VLRGLKAFLLRGNVVDLAVAVVVGAAFGAVVTALVADLITPIIAAIIGKPDFSALSFAINGSTFRYVAFVSIAAAAFVFVVQPVNALMRRRKTEPDVESWAWRGMSLRHSVHGRVSGSALSARHRSNPARSCGGPKGCGPRVVVGPGPSSSRYAPGGGQLRVGMLAHESIVLAAREVIVLILVVAVLVFVGYHVARDLRR